MNPDLEHRIQAASAALLAAMERGATDAARDLQEQHRALLAQRTPQDHAEMARRMGLPFRVAA